MTALYHNTTTIIAALLLALVDGTWCPADEAEISAGVADEQGFVVHDVRSPFQAGETRIRVLLPTDLDRAKSYRVLYVLPVEAKDGSRYGDGLKEIKKHNLHNKHQLICVAPTFSHLPWYADHPSNAEIRQEAYFLDVVAPYVERAYPARKERSGRLLVGFSKSGWGAFSLLLRHSDKFEAAAAWDAPLMKAEPNQFGMGPIFGSQANFENYQIATLFEKHREQFQYRVRLVLTGYGSFRQHHESAHKLMQELKIQHVYRDGPQRKHDWHSGWLAESLEMLLAQ